MYAFIHIPKTAGSTARHILRCSYGTRHCDIKARRSARATHTWLGPEDVRRARRCYPRLSGIVGHRVVSFAGLQDEQTPFRFFTFVREPLARFESHCYHHLRGEGLPATRDHVRTFCEDRQRHNVQSTWLGDDGTAEQAMATLEKDGVFVGLTEHFDASLLMLQKWLDCPDLNIHYRSRNQRPQTHSSRLLDDPEIQSWMEAANQQDLVLYRYVLDVILPKQCAEYGPTLENDVERFQVENKDFAGCEEPLAARMKRNLLYKPMLYV